MAGKGRRGGALSSVALAPLAQTAGVSMVIKPAFAVCDLRKHVQFSERKCHN